MKKNGMLTMGLCAALTIPFFAGCGDDRAKGKLKINFWLAVDTVSNNVVKEIVDAYNNENEDNVYVTLTRQSAGYSSSLTSTLQGSAVPDVVQIGEKYFKNYAVQGLLADIGQYLTAEDIGQGGDFDLNDVYPSVLDRYRIDPETGEGGGDNPILGLPYSVSPTMIYYNKTQFDEQRVNVISVAEADLPQSVLPHGYYVYDTAPTIAGVTMQPRSDGKYHVFNDRIAMNWEELRELSKIFTKEFNTSSTSRYGFLNEWWFSYGWSVGGDCLEWSDTMNGGRGQYFFALGDTAPNYLVTGDGEITVNGTAYREGDILSYEDKKYVEANATQENVSQYISSERLYPLPSTRDAFTEFVRLSQITSKPVNRAGDLGYGISPSPTTLSQKGKTMYFTSGEVAMLCEEYGAMRTFNDTMTPLGKEWGVAPLYRYTEYEKSGEVKTVNGTPVRGREAAHSLSTCLAIPKNSRRPKQAANFIKYFNGKISQKKYMEATDIISVNMSQNSDFLNLTNSFVPNKSTVARIVSYCTPGDWSYVENGNWIPGWSDILNKQVRDGDMTLEQFFTHKDVVATDTLLRNYKSKKYTGR